MTRSIADIGASLDALTAADFDPGSVQADGWERLAQLCDELEQGHSDDVSAVSLLLLGFVERLDGADIGSPGPVVHLLEKLPGYEEFLGESLTRKPARLTVWMANRILNTSVDDRGRWLGWLRTASMDEALPLETRDSARGFLSYQESRDM